MKLVNAKHRCDVAAAKGFGIPALNNKGGNHEHHVCRIARTCSNIRDAAVRLCLSTASSILNSFSRHGWVSINF